MRIEMLHQARYRESPTTGRRVTRHRMFTGFIRDISERKQAEEMRNTAVEFLTKPFSDQDVLDAVRTALGRRRGRSEQEQESSKIRQRFESLTPREKEVISMVVSGMLNKQISGKLGNSENTVKVQRSRAMEKMQARSLPGLVRMMEFLKSLSEEQGKRKYYADFTFCVIDSLSILGIPLNPQF